MRASEQIAVSLVDMSYEEALALQGKYGLYELRLDRLDWQIKEYRSFCTSSKVIITHRDTGGNRILTLDQLDWSQIDYFDVDISGDQEYLDYARRQRQSHDFTLICSHHDYDAYVSAEQYISSHAGRFFGDLVKIASMVDRREDMWDLITQMRRFPEHIILGMGRYASKTRCAGLQSGQPIVYSYPQGHGKAAPGQISAEELSIHLQVQDSADRLYGVIGHPISHSKSPMIFGQMMLHEELPHHYTRIALDEMDQLDELHYLPLDAVNVTAPFKYGPDAYLGKGIDEAKNNLDLRITSPASYNSDIDGIRSALLAHVNQRESKILIVGSGGAAEAAIRAVMDRSASCGICARSLDKCLSLKSRYPQLQIRDWARVSEEIQAFDIIIWTVPASVVQDKRISFSQNQWILDANYKEPLTDLIHISRYISALEWLKHQASHMMSLIAPEHDEGLLDRLQLSEKSMGSNSLAIIGLPSSGKSTIGSLLADKTDRKLVDMDQLIEEQEGSSVRSIFAEKGETYFRHLEHRVLQDLCAEDQLIISTGGGVVTQMENHDLLKSMHTIWLCLNPMTCAERVHGDARPMFAENSAIDTMTRLHHERWRGYARSSDMMMICDGLNQQQISDRIYEEYRHIF